ncbi:MAG: (2Fe-2S)-binding protein [Myxococcota bacterium]|nr:(2Fe-2S)-binding protein [Myxococcota bacterium]
MKLTLKVNGDPRSAEVPALKRLLDLLREDLQLTGAKEGCGEGECGACAVWIDGQLVNSCLVPASQVQGAEVVTIEGLAQNGVLQPVQQAFLEHNGAQCGICTPGMVMAAEKLLRSGKETTDANVREALAGNLCRCTGYQKIIDAVRAVGSR